MPDYTTDQADEAVTLAETADDADTPAPGITKVREELEGVKAHETQGSMPETPFATGHRSAGMDLGARSFGEAFARAQTNYGDEYVPDPPVKGFEPGSFDTHAKDPVLETAKKSPEEIERILFDDGERASSAPFNGPAPYVESDAEREKRLEWEARDQRRDACHIAARMHQGRGLNMRDFLDECDVIAEYIRDGYLPDFTA